MHPFGGLLISCSADYECSADEVGGASFRPPAGSAVPMAVALGGALAARLLVSALLVGALLVGASAVPLAGPRPAPTAGAVHLREFVDFQIAHVKESFLANAAMSAAFSALRQNSANANQRADLT
jgi:hypothetical protein